MRIVPWLTLTLLAAVATHAALLFAGPRLLMEIILSRMTQEAPVNTASFPPKPTAETDRIVRSSPDLFYSICPYDLSKGALSIEGRVPPGTYWSVSFYDLNTDNFAVINDRQTGPTYRIWLRSADQAEAPSPARDIISTTPRGLVLFRTLIDTPSREADLDAARKQVTCQTVAGG
jgi:uncharacterized membrane protein